MSFYLQLIFLRHSPRGNAGVSKCRDRPYRRAESIPVSCREALECGPHQVGRPRQASGRSKGSHLDRSDLRPYVGTWSKLRLYPRWSWWPRGLRLTPYSTSFRLLRCILAHVAVGSVGAIKLRDRHGGTCFDCGRRRGVARPSAHQINAACQPPSTNSRWRVEWPTVATG